MTHTTLDAFTEAYIEAALWSSMDESDGDTGGEPLDANFTIDDIHPDTLAEMVKDCEDFQESFGQFIADDESQAGHDFWLTRNGHGAGFWDGDWEQPYPAHKLPDETDAQYDFRSTTTPYGTVGDYLTAMSKPYGEFNLYVGDDGMIYGS